MTGKEEINCAQVKISFGHRPSGGEYEPYIEADRIIANEYTLVEKFPWEDGVRWMVRRTWDELLRLYEYERKKGYAFQERGAASVDEEEQAEDGEEVGQENR